MKDTLHYIVSKIVEKIDAIVIVEETEGDRIVLKLTVDPTDMGKIIGKQGRTIRAIRDVIKLMAARQNLYVDVILDEQAPQEVISQ